jgi:hypothetical protein
MRMQSILVGLGVFAVVIALGLFFGWWKR